MPERLFSDSLPDPVRRDGAGGASQLPPMRVPAAELFKGRRELIILHNAAEYRLRVTSNDKLILTK